MLDFFKKNRKDIVIGIIIIVVYFVILHPWVMRFINVLRPKPEALAGAESLSFEEKQRLNTLVDIIYNDVTGWDWTLGFGKSNVVPEDLWPLNDNQLYYVGNRYFVLHGKRLSKVIDTDQGEWYYYTSGENRDRHKNVVKRLQNLGV